MKSTGIIRRIDDLGRFAIPKEIRRQIHLKEGDPLEIFVDSGQIVLRKYRPLSDAPRTLTEIIGDLTDEYIHTLSDDQESRDKINEVIAILEKAEEKIKEI